MRDVFHRLSTFVSNAVGSPYSFVLAIIVILAWAISGPIFKFSDTWQLVINTGTTIITFLMVFLIQNTQNRDSKAVHLKLDELLRATRSARNQIINVEDMSDEELESLHTEFSEFHQKTASALERRKIKQKQT